MTRKSDGARFWSSCNSLLNYRVERPFSRRSLIVVFAAPPKKHGGKDRSIKQFQKKKRKGLYSFFDKNQGNFRFHMFYDHI